MEMSLLGWVVGAALLDEWHEEEDREKSASCLGFDIIVS